MFSLQIRRPRPAKTAVASVAGRLVGRRAGVVAVAAITAAVLVAALPANAATRAATVGPTTGMLFGAAMTQATGQNASQTAAAMESTIGRSLGVDRSYSRWDATQPSTTVVDDSQHGRTPMLSITAQRTDGSKVSWASIAAGNEDATIRAQADGLRDLGTPLILIFQHEADVAVGYGTSADFVAAYRHYVTIFRGENATNVAFGWVLTSGGFSNPTPWYPGASYVDWIGADVYNAAGCAPGLSGWRSLAVAGARFYAWGSAQGKPLMLPEWGSAEDPNQPGRKAAWLEDAATTLAGWPAIKAVSYFDHVGTCDWRLATSPSAQAAFADISHQAWANGGPSARLLTSVAVGAANLNETFDLSTSTGSNSTTGTGVTAWTLNFGDGTPAASGTGEPSTVAHTYLPGHFTATLTVTDASGLKATTTAPVISTAAPTVTEGGTGSNITTTSATVPGWIITDSLAGTYVYQWGTTTAYGHQSAPAPLAALGYTQPVTGSLTGLAPGTRCYWRIVATTPGGTTTGPARWFSTLSS